MSLKNWFTTAALNNSAPPNGAPESSTYLADVNDILRQNMAVTRTLAASDTIASAATCDIGSKDATFLSVTGTTGITALGTVSVGIYKMLIFSDVLTLTHNGTSLILPTAANITTASDDTATMLSLGSGNWRCVAFNRKSGAPLSFAGAGALLAADNLSDLADAATSRANLGLTIGTTAGTIPLWESTLLNKTSAKTGAYTVVSADRGTVFLCTNTWTLSLTAAATLADGFAFAVRNTGTGTITIDPNASEQIDGVTTIALAAGESCVVVCNGTGFYTVAKSASSSWPVRTRTLSSGTSYTPPSDVKKMRVFVTGATGGLTGGDNRGGAGGAGYSEKYYSTVSGSYTYAIGAAGANTGTAGGTTSFDVMSVTGVAGVTTTSGSAGGVGSGGDFNASGGTGGAANGGHGGGGASGSRAGNGFAGGAGGTGSGFDGGGGGGGTGAAGTAASGLTGGAGGASSTTVSATAITAFDDIAGYAFDDGAAGTNGNGTSTSGNGGTGASSDETGAGISAGTSLGGGYGGKSSAQTGTAGRVVIWEYT